MGAETELAAAAIRKAWIAMSEAAELLRTTPAGAGAVGIERAAEDPHIVLRFGQLLARLHAAEILLARAARTEGTPVSTLNAREFAGTPLAVEIFAGAASAFAWEVGLEIIGQVQAWGAHLERERSERDTNTDSARLHYHWSYFHAGKSYLTIEQSPQGEELAPIALSRGPARVIASDAEAIQVARDVARALAPGASTRDRERRLPVEELELLSRAGLFGITVPRAFGGADVSTETLVKVFQILSAADPAIGQLPQNHFVFVDAIRQDGRPEQRKFFFSELLAGARLGNAQAERGGASALNLSTRLTRVPGGDYRLDGTKYYCTGAITAHWIPVAAIDDAGRMVLAYVRRDAAGVQVSQDWNAMGQRVTFSGTTVFANVAVTDSQVIEHWRIFERPNVFHPFAQLLHAAIDVGIAQNALDDTAAALRKRTRPRLGAPVQRALDDPHVVLRFGQILARLHASEALVLRGAQLIDRAGSEVNAGSAAEIAVAVSEAKAFAEDVAIEITNDIFALLGSSATDESLNLNRHWRNARTHTVHDANQWRYHSAGNYFLNGVLPTKPVRRPAE